MSGGVSECLRSPRPIKITSGNYQLNASAENFNFALNLNNLLNKQYYEGVRGRYGIVLGPPFGVVASAQIVF